MIALFIVYVVLGPPLLMLYSVERFFSRFRTGNDDV
jgi:hypothetical protein